VNSVWKDKSPADVLRDVNAALSELGQVAQPSEMWIPYSTYKLLKGWMVRGWLRKRKPNRRRPKFATAWNGR
jgi:hypothetical protein